MDGNTIRVPMWKSHPSYPLSSVPHFRKRSHLHFSYQHAFACFLRDRSDLIRSVYRDEILKCSPASAVLKEFLGLEVFAPPLHPTIDKSRSVSKAAFEILEPFSRQLDKIHLSTRVFHMWEGPIERERPRETSLSSCIIYKMSWTAMWSSSIMIELVNLTSGFIGNA